MIKRTTNVINQPNAWMQILAKYQNCPLYLQDNR